MKNMEEIEKNKKPFVPIPPDFKGLLHYGIFYTLHIVLLSILILDQMYFFEYKYLSTDYFILGFIVLNAWTFYLQLQTKIIHNVHISYIYLQLEKNDRLVNYYPMEFSIFFILSFLQICLLGTIAYHFTVYFEWEKLWLLLYITIFSLIKNLYLIIIIKNDLKKKGLL